MVNQLYSRSSNIHIITRRYYTTTLYDYILSNPKLDPNKSHTTMDPSREEVLTWVTAPPEEEEEASCMQVMTFS